MINKSILIAIDGSAYSNLALAYATDFFKDHTDVNFHLLNCTNLSGHDLHDSLDANNTLFPTNSTNTDRQEKANRYLQQAKKKIQHLGIDDQRLSFSAIPTNNIALAIQQEAEHRMVDSILVARRGLGLIGEMLFGSVSASLFRKCHTTPLWIIDGEVTKKNILISVDGSPASMMAVDHIAHVFSGREDQHFFLFHCHRFLTPEVQCNLESFYKDWDREWVNSYLAGDGCLFDGPARVLLDAGIPKDKITILPEATNIEESRSIISHARRNNCGTIVMGRRRARMAKGIFGEVSSRTILQTQNMALWLIG